jgi:hypothetical protein
MAQSKPYDVDGEPSTEKMEQSNQMFRELYALVAQLFVLVAAAGTGGGNTTATYLTKNSEITALPNSRMVSAGDGITFDSSVSGVLTIRSGGYWSPLTDGDSVQPEVIIDSNGEVVMTWVVL